MGAKKEHNSTVTGGSTSTLSNYLFLLRPQNSSHFLQIFFLSNLLSDVRFFENVQHSSPSPSLSTVIPLLVLREKNRGKVAHMRWKIDALLKIVYFLLFFSAEAERTSRPGCWLLVRHFYICSCLLHVKNRGFFRLNHCK